MVRLDGDLEHFATEVVEHVGDDLLSIDCYLAFQHVTIVLRVEDEVVVEQAPR